MNNLTVVDNPLVKRDLTILRDKETKEFQFRLSLRRIAYSMATQVSSEFKLREYDVETPLERTKGYQIDHPVVLIPVLRAGLSLVSSFIEMIPEAKVGHIGLQRDEETLEPVDYYFKTPRNLELSKVILLDPMLATGGSSSAAIDYLKKKGAKNCSFVCIVAAPEGVNKLTEEHPDVKVYTAALDRELNQNGYILPGLGDAGDRTFGTL